MLCFYKGDGNVERTVSHTFACFRCNLMYHAGDKIHIEQRANAYVVVCSNCKNDIAIVLNKKGDAEEKK